MQLLRLTYFGYGLQPVATSQHKQTPRSRKKPSDEAAHRSVRKKKVTKRSTPVRFTAATADRHELYQLSVQAADYEIAFFDRVFRAARGSKALSMREDFCGTALLSCAWANSTKATVIRATTLRPRRLSAIKRASQPRSW